jgi:hypothetical protein
MSPIKVRKHDDQQAKLVREFGEQGTCLAKTLFLSLDYLFICSVTRPVAFAGNRTNVAWVGYATDSPSSN